MPIAADESVRKAADPLAVARAGAADLLVIKAQPLGGIRAALRHRGGRPGCRSSSRARWTPRSASRWARTSPAALPELDYDCGLGTAALLAADVTDAPLLPVDGAIAVRRVEPSARCSTRHAAPRRAHARWWLARLERCYARADSPAEPVRRHGRSRLQARVGVQALEEQVDDGS